MENVNWFAIMFVVGISLIVMALTSLVMAVYLVPKAIAADRGRLAQEGSSVDPSSKVSRAKVLRKMPVLLTLVLCSAALAVVFLIVAALAVVSIHS
ncbi:hypothetical protein G7066_01225 [Leucobacter coleopterorum]|uniref:Uncharacterized protein n=1 Tax=Leucobacter coleopterorum TaxID=2714933 RepID=A0ABX6JTP7_9MICO|nr:hypothetical protein [Leucobacter coleopterorum]QIM17668.1 hypothetical protein G7066_01225 [Leucobacter coleopterorum]